MAQANVRRARFIGLAKTHLHHLCTALGLNGLRRDAWMGAWLADVNLRTMPRSPCAVLAPAAA
jgi:hypothetical protein